MPSNQKRNVLLAGAMLMLSACGGGGGGSDTAPDAFAFQSIDNAELGKVYTSSVKITGINARTSLTIEGGLFSLDGKDFISSPVIISK